MGIPRDVQNMLITFYAKLLLFFLKIRARGKSRGKHKTGTVIVVQYIGYTCHIMLNKNKSPREAMCVSVHQCVNK